VAFLLVVREELAEYLGSRHELPGGEVLVAHHKYMMIGEGAAERGAGVRVDRLGEVEADHLGGGVIRQGRDGEGRHEPIPPCSIF
jgi:hypothetical protein